MCINQHQVDYPYIRQKLVNSGGGPTCSIEEFECADGSTCVRKDKVLDGNSDCPDNSDEG